MRAAVVLVVALAIAGCGGTSQDTSEGTSTSAPPHSTSSATSERTSRTDTPVPEVLIAMRADGIVELSAADGQVRRRIADIPAGESPVWLEADRPHARLFFGTTDDCGDSRIWTVPLAGGRAEHLAYGEHASVSPDGARIAFPRIEDGCAATAVVILDLATGDEQVWRGPGKIGEVISVAWAPDSRHVAYDDMIDDRIRVFDSAEPSMELDGPVVAKGRLGDAVVVGDKWILAVTQPCDPSIGIDCEAPVHIVDGSTERTIETLPAVERLQRVDLDDTGQAVLLQIFDPADVHYERPLLARYDQRSVTKIVPAIAGDW